MDIQRDIGRLESKVDMLLERSTVAEEDRKEISTRITKLEEQVTFAKTLTNMATAFIAFAVTIAANLLGKLWGNS